MIALSVVQSQWWLRNPTETTSDYMVGPGGEWLGPDPGGQVKRIKSSWVILITVFGLLVVTGVALAAPEDKEDTVLNLGYDPESQVFVWNTSSLEGTHDCTLENGPVTATFIVNDEGLVMVDGLTHEGSTDPVQFPSRDGGDPVDYAGDGDCALSGGSVAGPNGQINHGMFMKLFNSLYEGKGRGCVVRHLAQLDLGQGDQQVKVGDETDVETEETDDTAPIDFTTVEADCEKGGADTGLEDSNGNGNGKPDSAGKPESPGKSASAPGKNK